MISDGPLDRLLRGIANRRAQRSATDEKILLLPRSDAAEGQDNSEETANQAAPPVPKDIIEPKSQCYHVKSLSEKYKVTKWMAVGSEKDGPRKDHSKDIMPLFVMAIAI